MFRPGHRRAVLAAALLLPALAGCQSGLDDIDADIARLVDRRSERTGLNASPEPAPTDPKAVERPSQWDSEVLTTNPSPEELRYDPRAEAEDAAERLARFAEAALHGQPGQEVRRIGLEDAFRIAQRTGREHRTAEEDYILAAIRLLVERHLWSPRLFDDLSVEVAGQGDDGSFDSAARVLNDLRVSQRLPYGGEVSAGVIFAATEQLRESVTERYRQSAEIVLDATIPLLRGAGLVAREDLIQAERDLIYQARDFERFRRQLLVSIALDYFDLLQAKAEIDNQVRQIESLRRLEEATAARVEAGRVAEFNLALVQNQVLGAEATLAGQRERYLLALDRFKIRLGVPITEPVDVLPLEFDLPLPEVTLEEATERALLYRLDLQNRRDLVDDARRAIAVARNQLLPDLDLRASAGLPTDPDDRIGDARFSPGDADYTASLTLGLPLDRRIERLRLRQAVIGYERQAREYERFRDEVILDVRRAVRDIDQARFQLRLAEERVRINARRLEEQNLRSEEIDPLDIVITHNDLLDAENERDRAVTALRTAILDYLLQSGQLRVRRDGTFQALPGMEAPAAPPAR